MVEKSPQRSLGMIIARNTVMVTAGTGLLKLINFLFNVYVIRQLGDDRYGQYSVVLAFVGIYQIFAELGVSQFGMRETAKDRTRTEDLFWNLVSVRTILGVIAVIVMPLLATALNYDAQLVQGIFLFGCTFLLAAVLAPLEGVLAAHERFDYVTAISIVSQVTFVIFGGSFLLSGRSYIWLIVASLIASVPAIALALFAVIHNRYLHMRVQIRPKTWYGLVRGGLPFAVIALTLSLSYKVDTILLKQYTNDSMVGWYNAAYNLVFSLMFLINGFKEAIVPSLARTYVSDPGQVARWYHRTVKVLLIISLPIAVGGTIVAFPLIRLLYTDAYLPSALALMVLIWDVPFLMYTAFCGNITTVINEERQAARIYGINAIANILLNLWAIPRYGVMAAAIITVATDLIGMIQFYWMLNRKLSHQDLRMELAKTLAASAIMGVVVYLFRDLHVLINIGIGAAVYIVMILILRLFDSNEWSMILRLLRPSRQT